MIDKVKVMLRDGSLISLPEWQAMYGLTDPNSIGKYFSLTESRFKRDIIDYGELIVNELLMRVKDAYRKATGHSITTNSFNRNEVKQAQLRKGGFRAATYSPHVVKLASDMDTPGVEDLAGRHPEWNAETLKKEAERLNYLEVIHLREAASALGIKIRVGHKQYLAAGQTFIHVDVCPEYYAPGKPFHHLFHPAVWEKEITW